jgi:hypothetical protein
VLPTGRSVDSSHGVGCRKVRVNGCIQRWGPVTTGKRRSLMAIDDLGWKARRYYYLHIDWSTMLVAVRRTCQHLDGTDQ